MLFKKSVALFIMLALAPLSAMAFEINGTVSQVDAGDWVVIRLPAGAVVAEGDDVRIRTKLPNIGFVAIKTHWRVTRATDGKAMAIPVGEPTGKPQVGYMAVIKTSARQPTAPIARGPAPVHECDRLAAHETDKDAVTRAVDFSDINAGAVISTCTAAFRQRPDTSRFLTQLGSGQMKAGQRNQAFVTFSKAARMGSAQSMAFLAIMHKNGWGTQKSLSEALHWFDKAAQNGNASGMVFAASMYFHGQGTSRNYNRAAKWYQAAVNEGYPEAMFSLSNLYDNGQGVRRDSGRAANLMLLAFKRGHKGAQDALISNSRNMSVEMRRGIQNLLASKGIYNGPIDGKFGSGTTRALRTFAKRKN